MPSSTRPFSTPRLANADIRELDSAATRSSLVRRWVAATMIAAVGVAVVLLIVAAEI
jgi:hypothetical protein